MTPEDIESIKNRLDRRSWSPSQEALFVGCAPADIRELLDYVEELEAEVAALKAKIASLTR